MPSRCEERVRDPYLLEFLDLKDEYSESDLEDALDPAPGVRFCWNWGPASPSSPGRNAFASATSGIASTCCFSTAGYGAWW